MNSKQYIGVLTTLLAIGTGFLYWYGYRPSEIRKVCFNESDSFSANSNATATLLGKELKYDNCLKRNGLKAERQLMHLNINSD